MKKTGFVLTFVCILVVAVSIGAAALLASAPPPADGHAASSGSQSSAPADPGELEDNEGVDHQQAVHDGRLPGYEDAEINTDRNAFFYLLNSEVVFDKPSAAGNVMIENTVGNVYNMDVGFALEDTGEEIYRSAVLEPGQYVVSDKLDVLVKKGVYDVLATISVFDPDTGDLVETYSENIVLTVNNKLF